MSESKNTLRLGLPKGSLAGFERGVNISVDLQASAPRVDEHRTAAGGHDVAADEAARGRGERQRDDEERLHRRAAEVERAGGVEIGHQDPLARRQDLGRLAHEAHAGHDQGLRGMVTAESRHLQRVRDAAAGFLGQVLQVPIDVVVRHQHRLLLLEQLADARLELRAFLGACTKAERHSMEFPALVYRRGGLEALTLSIPPAPGDSIVKRPENEHLFSLGYVFKDQGYATKFIYGGYGYFDNMNYFFSNNSPKTPQFIEQSKGGGTNRFITIQTDYADPITSSMKIEAGLRAAFRNFTSFNNNFVQTTPGQYLLIPGLSNDYKFNDELYAGYLTFSHQRKKLSYQLGLRAESSSYTGNLVSKNQKFKTEYPLSLFPSAFATYKLNDKEDMQLNYSRKINRPNFFQLIPFIDYSDSLNLSVGNPGLIPEFTNLLELSYSNQYKAGNSLLATVYFRNTNDLITRYQYKDANPNPARADSVIITTYANANRSYTVGLELTGKNKPAKWWDLTTNLNLFNSTIKAGNIPGTVSSSLFSWFAKINNNFKLPKNFSIQLSADYTAKTLVAPGGGGSRGGMGMMFGGGSQPSAQGYIKPIFGADFSIRKEFLKNNAASITLQFSDIFRTRLYATHNESAFFVQDNERRRDPQFVRLNFNWRFGKIDVSLFKRKNLKGEMENMQNAQQGMGGN